MPYPHHQFFMFLLIGTLNTAIGYGLFALFLYIGCHYTLAALLATIIGVCINFQTTGRIVFKNKNKRLFFHFINLYAVIYIVNIALIKILHLFIFNLYIAGAIASALMAPFSFYSNKQWVFAKK